MVIPAEVELEIRGVLTELDKLGACGMLVGGCVRDMVFGKIYSREVKPKDFDVEVYGLTDNELVSF
jgi:tRNA nucleotidyltransferase/poly(A) polymerase